MAILCGAKGPIGCIIWTVCHIEGSWTRPPGCIGCIKEIGYNRARGSVGNLSWYGKGKLLGEGLLERGDAERRRLLLLLEGSLLSL